MNPTPVLNDLGQWLVYNLGPLSLELALWTAVVLLILTVLRVHSPALRHLAWVLILLKPLSTLLLQSPVTFYSLLPSFAEKPLLASDMPTPAGQISGSVLPVSVAVSATTPSLSGYGMLALLWGAIAFMLLLRLIVGQVYLARLLRRASRVNSGPLHQLLQEAAAGLGIRRPVQLALADRGGPLVAGILRPLVILPHHLAETLSPEQLRLIFAHELAHVRRFDNLALLGQQLVEVLLFFHPSAWLCRRGLRLEAEKACDDAVLRRFPQPAHYADSLARVAELCSCPKPNLLINTFAAAESRLGWRITRILEATPMSSSRTLTTFTVLALSAASCLGLPGVLHKSSEKPELFANEPNPFSDHTSFKFALPERLPVTLEIFDAAGTRVRTIIKDTLGPGGREGKSLGHSDNLATWSGDDDTGRKVPSGLYFCRLTAGEFVLTRKMMLARPEDIVETKGNVTVMRGGPTTENIGTPTIDLKIYERGAVKITVFDARGTLVHTLVDSVLETGAYRFSWDGVDNDKMKPGPGWYLFIVEAGNTVKSYKWVVE